MDSATYLNALRAVPRHLADVRDRDTTLGLAPILEGLALWRTRRVEAVAALLDAATADTKSSVSPQVAPALDALRAAVEQAARAHNKLWAGVLEDPLEANLPVAAAHALGAMEEAERTLEHLRDTCQPAARCETATAALVPMRLQLVEWLELLELRFAIERRSSRSPLQLCRLAQLTRVVASHRAAQLLGRALP